MPANTMFLQSSAEMPVAPMTRILELRILRKRERERKKGERKKYGEGEEKNNSLLKKMMRKESAGLRLGYAREEPGLCCQSRRALRAHACTQAVGRHFSFGMEYSCIHFKIYISLLDTHRRCDSNPQSRICRSYCVASCAESAPLESAIRERLALGSVIWLDLCGKN